MNGTDAPQPRSPAEVVCPAAARIGVSAMIALCCRGRGEAFAARDGGCPQTMAR